MIPALFLILVALFVVLPLIGMALWALVSTVVTGLVIGALGRLVVPGHHPIGFLGTVLSGLTGAIIGGFLGSRVLAVGWFPTVLLEIGISAAMVALLSRPARRHLPH